MLTDLGVGGRKEWTMSPGPRTSVPGWEETVAQQEAAGSVWLVAFRWQCWPSAKAQ